MVGKMILPLLGGSPSVWNSCLFFFQATLLLGYGYSHLTTRWLGVRRQAILHVVVLLLPIAFLPIVVGGVPPEAGNFTIWLIRKLAVWVGLPFFVVSTSAPLVQKWFAQAGHSDSSDPYFLYAASNVGSLLGVLSYPTLLEPNLLLTEQSRLWAIAYGVLVCLTLGCAISVWRQASFQEKGETLAPIVEKKAEAPSLKQQLQWVLLSFLPSSLLLGITTYLTTDLAAIPLVWAIPLAIYLLSFILTFARKPLLPHQGLVTVLPLFLTPLILLSLLMVTKPIAVLVLLHLVGFFIFSCVFHGELARSRPSADYITLFYFWVSFGGVLGGLFNAIAAPLLFPTILEYPLMMGLGLILLRAPNPDREKSQPWVSLQKTLPISIGLLLGSLIVGFQFQGFNRHLFGILFSIILVFGIRYAFTLNRLRFGVGLSLIILLAQFTIPSMGGILQTERSFFGVNRVLADRRGEYHVLLHGTTVHGKQSLEPQRRNEPLTYFHPTGPIGQVFQDFNSSHSQANVGILGLGIGTLAAYSQPQQNWTFYEIDPVVEEIARNPDYFTYLQDSKAPFSVVLGDGRLRLKQVRDRYYNLMVMDAFSSDSIPVHLVTQEAIQLYFSKLTLDGLLAINITNRFINLEPILSSLAKQLNLSALQQLDLEVSPEAKAMGKTPSHWVILARHPEDFGNLIKDARWQPLAEASASVWTDNFSNIFTALRLFTPRARVNSIS